MSGSIALGFVPTALTVTLAEGGGFTSALVSDGGDWPDGTVIALEFDNAPPIVWPASISGPRAQWDIDPDQVAQVYELGGRTRVKLTHTAPDATRIVWATGTAAHAR